MYRILAREDLTPNIHLFKVEAPLVAKKAQPGQFVVVRSDEKGERIPLTIADWDKEEENVTIVFMEVGTTTRKLALLNAGDSILDFVGPLGRPTEIEKFGTVVCVAGGFAIATIVPIARVGGETKFACVDGPDFDGHEVDWDLLMNRLRAYLDEEQESLKLWEERNKALIN